MAATLCEIGKHDVESPTKADETVLRPLSQKMGKVFGRCASKRVRTELVDGLGSTYGFHNMEKKESMDVWLKRVLYSVCMFFYDKPFQEQSGVMAFLQARE